jgi:hypothetical protein
VVSVYDASSSIYASKSPEHKRAIARRLMDMAAAFLPGK